jgi:sulfoxide reductase catalytic subunit YedY
VIERNVLLICPGFFAYNGRWKGVSSSTLLSGAKLEPQVTHVEFSGPKGRGRMTKKFTLEEVMTDKIFIAYRVNGRPLPEKHGFPVRLVAENHYGGRWVKYVDKISVIAK